MNFQSLKQSFSAMNDRHKIQTHMRMHMDIKRNH